MNNEIKEIADDAARNLRAAGMPKVEVICGPDKQDTKKQYFQKLNEFDVELTRVLVVNEPKALEVLNSVSGKYEEIIKRPEYQPVVKFLRSLGAPEDYAAWGLIIQGAGNAWNVGSQYADPLSELAIGVINDVIPKLKEIK